MKKSNALRAMRKSMSKPMENFCFHSLCLLVKKKMSNFAFTIHKMSSTYEKTFKKKENELFYDTPGSTAAKLEAVKDSFRDKGLHCACADAVKLN